MKPNIDYGAELKHIINEKDINRVELAKARGCTPGNVQKAMNNPGMKRKTFDEWMQAIEILAERKRNDILETALRQNIETAQKALKEIEKLKR